MNQKGFAQLLLVMLLMAGIGVGVYLIQFTQVFKPKAQIQGVTSTIPTYESEPLTLVNSYPKRPNGLKTSFMLYFGDQSKFTPENKQFIAKAYDYGWIKNASEVLANPGSLSGPSDFSYIFNAIRDIKQINPNIKMGLYVGGIAVPDSHHPHFDFLDDSDLLHTTAGQPLKLVPSTPMKPAEARQSVINYTRPQTRAKIIQKWKDMLINNNIDGITFDAVHPEYIGIYVKQKFAPNGCLEGACGTTKFWEDSLTTFSLELSTELAKYNKDVYHNGLQTYDYSPNDPADQFAGPTFTKLADLVVQGGVLAEHVPRMHINLSYFKEYLEAAKTVVQKKKQVFFFFQPEILNLTEPRNCLNLNDFSSCGQNCIDPNKCNPNYTCTSPNDLTSCHRYCVDPYDANTCSSYFTRTNTTNGLNLERFYLATFLLIRNDPYTYVGYNPGTVYTVLPTLYYYRDWNLDFGNPQNPYETNYAVAPNGLYYRGYDNGVVYVNPTDQPITNALAPQQTYLLWDPCTGRQVKDSMTFPPKSGTFLFYATRGCPNPLPSPSQTFNVSNITGDIAPGNQTFSWDKKTGAVKYTLKIDDQSNAFNQQCDGNNLEGDQCETNLTANNFTFNFVKDHSYHVQIFQYNSTGAQIGDPSGVIVKAAAANNTGKVGDTDGDNDVDIFDFNQVITDFGKKNDPSTKADLDNDDDVDIFDFNIVVTNFGK